MKLYLLLLLLLVPFVQAEGLQTIANPGQNVTLFLDCMFSDNFVQSNANLTILYPNQTAFIDNIALNNYSIGKFAYTFISPQTLGNYEIELFCDDTENNRQGYATGVLQVKDFEGEILGSLAIVFGLLAIMSALFYMSYNASNKKKVTNDKAQGWVNKVSNPDFISVCLHIMAVWMIPLVFFALIGTGQEALFQTLIYISIILVTLYSIVYSIMYVLFLIYVKTWEERDNYLKVPKR